MKDLYTIATVSFKILLALWWWFPALTNNFVMDSVFATNLCTSKKFLSDSSRER